MKRMLYGVILGSIFTLVGSFVLGSYETETPESLTAKEKIKYEEIMHEAEMNKKNYVQFIEKYESLNQEHRELVENHRLIKGTSEIYTAFVSSLLHGDLNLTYEVISSGEKNKPNTTVVYAEEYSHLPQNQDLQKVYLLLLIDQLNGITTERVEFWSNRDHALAYITGDYELDGIEGWTGENSRFGLLINTEPKTFLVHILSTHERDVISIGKYTDGYSMLNMKDTINKLESFIRSVQNGQSDSIDLVTVFSDGNESVRKLTFDGKAITNSMYGRDEPVCSGVNKQRRNNKFVFQLTGCNNTAGILEINIYGD